MTKDFTQSERVAIARAIEEQYKNRRGSNQFQTKLDRKNFCEAKERRTDQIAAEKAGFGNETTYRQAKKVVETGTPELVKALDENRIKPSVAASLTLRFHHLDFTFKPDLVCDSPANHPPFHH